jgi:hypothetical protein
VIRPPAGVTGVQELQEEELAVADERIVFYSATPELL